MIQLGDEGPGVRAWQRIVGLGPSKADGKFGPGTRAAVCIWQMTQGVDPDGVIGPLTRAAVSPIALIKPYEGLRLWTYDDSDGAQLRLIENVWRRPDGSICRGVPTIGWGDTEPPRRGVQVCTPAEADGWLAVRIARTFLPAAKRYAPPGADAAWIAAATSCAYNCGTGWIAQLAAGGFTEKLWMSRVHNGRGEVVHGLPERRAEEYALAYG